MDSHEESFYQSQIYSKSQAPPMCHVCLVKPAFGLRRHVLLSSTMVCAIPSCMLGMWGGTLLNLKNDGAH